MRNVSAPVETSGTLDTSNARRVGLDKDRIGMLMGLLIDQYTRKHLAALREYFCNAWDAHVDAGNTGEPVLVSLPNEFQPSLVIQDHGVGLTSDAMFSVFGTYGASTKTDSDRTTGGMGIGSKSAWTLGQQFIVTSVKDGRKTTALFALDDEGYGTCDFIGTPDAPTDEPNGTTVSLPVTDVDAMREDAAFFFETVDRGLVLVDGEEPTPIWETAKKINDSTWVRPDHDGKVYLVQGQVPYLVDEEILRQVNKKIAALTGEDNSLAQNMGRWGQVSDGTSVYFKVPIDSVNHHPSRERLRDTNLTINALASLVLGLSQDLTDKVQEEIEAAPSLYEAALVADRLVNDLGAFQVSRKRFTYKGVKVRKTAKIDLRSFFTTNKSWRSSVKIVGSGDSVTLDADQVQKTLTVTGVKPGEEGKVSRYVKRYMENTERDVARIFVSENPWGAFDWFAFGIEHGAPTITLDEYKAELRSMREVKARTVNEPSYSTGWSVTASRDLVDRDLLTDIVSWGKDVTVYYERSRDNYGFTKAALDGEVTPVVLLPQQSEDALLKRLTEAGVRVMGPSERQERTKAYVREQFDQISADDKAALSAARWIQAHLSYSRKSWVHDLRDTLGGLWDEVQHTGLQDIIDMVDIIVMVASDLDDTRRERLVRMAEYLGEALDVETFDYVMPTEHEMFPLIAQVSNWTIKRDEDIKADVVKYINSRA